MNKRGDTVVVHGLGAEPPTASGGQRRRRSKYWRFIGEPDWHDFGSTFAANSWPSVTRFDLRDNRAMPSTLSESLAPIVLPDADGTQVRLGSLWESSPAVVVFLRHYG